MLLHRNLKSTIYRDIFSTINSDSALHSYGATMPMSTFYNTGRQTTAHSPHVAHKVYRYLYGLQIFPDSSLNSYVPRHSQINITYLYTMCPKKSGQQNKLP